jgi:hypothetical protein
MDGFLVASGVVKKASVIPLTCEEARSHLVQPASAFNAFTTIDDIAWPGLLKDLDSDEVIGVLAFDDAVVSNRSFDILLLLCAVPVRVFTFQPQEQLDCMAISNAGSLGGAYRRVGIGWITQFTWFEVRKPTAQDTDHNGVVEMRAYEGLKRRVTII